MECWGYVHLHRSGGYAIYTCAILDGNWTILYHRMNGSADLNSITHGWVVTQSFEPEEANRNDEYSDDYDQRIIIS